MEYTYDIDDIDTIAQTILRNATSKTLLFYGEMGVGKTTMIKALSKQLGNVDTVSSPTFSIVNEYEIPDSVIYHFDLFRIKNEQEALDFGIEDYLFSKAWIFMEWPEKLGDLLPDFYNKIEITANFDGSRTLKMDVKNSLTKQNA